MIKLEELSYNDKIVLTISLDEKDNSLVFTDKNNHSIVMSESGINIKSEKNITIHAAQNLILKGDKGVKIESSRRDVQIKGVNIKEFASKGYSAQGRVSASLMGGRETKIKGAIVKIN